MEKGKLIQAVKANAKKVGLVVGGAALVVGMLLVAGSKMKKKNALDDGLTVLDVNQTNSDNSQI
jgi:hypothetical protein